MRIIWSRPIAIVTNSVVMAARICTWEDLSLTDAERLLKASEATETLQQVLSELLGLGDLASASKQALIELDLYTYALLFAKSNHFTAEQTSTFFTILKSVHLMCISTPFDNLQETFEHFKQLLLRHSINRPPFSVGLFSSAQVRDITDYVLKTYFKHFKLYKYAFTKRVHLNLKIGYPEVPPSPEPSQTSLTGAGGGQAEPELKEEESQNEEPQPAGAEDTGKEAVEEREEEPLLSPEQEYLRRLVASSLAEQVKELKVAVDKEMSEQDKRLTERLKVLETAVDGKGKKSK